MGWFQPVFAGNENGFVQWSNRFAAARPKKPLHEIATAIGMLPGRVFWVAKAAHERRATRRSGNLKRPGKCKSCKKGRYGGAPAYDQADRRTGIAPYL